MHVHPGIEHDIGPHDATDGAGRPHHGNGRVAGEHHLQQRRRQPAQQVKNHEPDRAHGILDVIAENPQKPEIADQMQPAAVQEHGGEQRVPAGTGGNDAGHPRAYGKACSHRQAAGQIARHQPQLTNRARQGGLGAQPLNQHPRQGVEADDRHGGPGCGEMGVFVANGDHGLRPALQHTKPDHSGSPRANPPPGGDADSPRLWGLK